LTFQLLTALSKKYYISYIMSVRLRMMNFNEKKAFLHDPLRPRPPLTLDAAVRTSARAARTLPLFKWSYCLFVFNSVLVVLAGMS